MVVTENEMMAVRRKEVHMDVYDNCGKGEGGLGGRGWSMATAIGLLF